MLGGGRKVLGFRVSSRSLGRTACSSLSRCPVTWCVLPYPTVRISLASADQRRGRAGRVAPGTCYRLWSESAHAGLAPDTPPEIRSADLAPLALDLANWGADPGDLPWLDPPPAGQMEAARDLLVRLGGG